MSFLLLSHNVLYLPFRCFRDSGHNRLPDPHALFHNRNNAWVGRPARHIGSDIEFSGICAPDRSPLVRQLYHVRYQAFICSRTCQPDSLCFIFANMPSQPTLLDAYFFPLVRIYTSTMRLTSASLCMVRRKVASLATFLVLKSVITHKCRVCATPLIKRSQKPMSSKIYLIPFADTITNVVYYDWSPVGK